MKVFSIAKGFRIVKNAPPELSQKEQDRLRAINILTIASDPITLWAK